MESASSDVDASFEALFEELRRDTEAEVSRILFG
jgi:vacuolar-type H+-ATPase subunit E/Vma4